MKFPIAERELRVAARSPRVYRGRLVAGAVFGLMTGWSLWLTRIAFNQQAAAMTYTFVTNVAMMMCIFSAAATSDSISSEKRGGTLGFLFLTDLKGADVVFGKLLASGLMSFYGLLAILPMSSMPVLMGGITGQSVFRSSVALLNALFFALSAGLWISTRSWEQKRAANAAVWIGVFLLWMLPGLAALLEQRYGWLGTAMVLKVFSPAYQLQHANPFGVGMIFERFWTSVAATHALGWIALWRASVTLPHRWQDRPEPVAGRFRRWWNDLRLGAPEVRKALRKRLLDMNAVHWLTSRELFAPLMAWVLVAFCVLGGIGIWIWLTFTIRGGNVPLWGVGIPVAAVIQVGLRMRSCSLAADTLARDRFSGALELLLSTSLTIDEVSRGIWLTVRRVVMGPAIAGLALAVMVYLLAAADRSVNEPAIGLLVLLCTSVLFVADIIASVWTGLWMSCCSHQANAATGLCILRLLALPWFSFFGLISVMSALKIGVFFDSFERVFITWFSFCMVNNIFWISRSRRKFYENIRVAAAERTQRPRAKSFWKRLRPGQRAAWSGNSNANLLGQTRS